MTSNGKAFLLGHNEVQYMLQIKHIPHLDNTILAATGNNIVLIKLIKSLSVLSPLLLRIELIWAHILKVKSLHLILRAVARFKLNCEILNKIQQPE